MGRRNVSSPSSPELSQRDQIKKLLNEINTLERQLDEKTSEYDQLQSEFARIPVSHGSIATRRRRIEVEERLDTLRDEIGGVKMRLKQLHAI
jgi:predicted RNase H-like nuclease (RuvC/YqgF family)